MYDWVNVALAWFVLLAQVVVAAFASGHAILHKRDVRSAIGWVGLIWLVPYIGALLYGFFGINRIRRRATELRTGRRPPQPGEATPASSPLVRRHLPAHNHHLGAIATLLDRIAPFPLTAGNRVRMFDNGSDAYAAMHAAIASARHSVGLATYIFDNDRCGRRFVQALASARERGVDVRVLIDGVGAYYTYPAILGPLKRAGVPAVEFLPTLFPLHLAYANLRSHRKILVVDGRTGFTGGMNIRDAQADESDPRRAIRDVHFQIDGPAVAHLETTFLDDWRFAAGAAADDLVRDDSAPNPAATPADARTTDGTTLARGIAGGPDENFESIRWAILAALSQAQQRIRIVTPYFVPDQMLISSLILAAMRGVAIDIVVPEKNNLVLVQWASQAKATHLLARGCRIWRTPPPFDHSKLMTVDDAWALIGSANWDQRSLRLNFEFDVECYDPELVGQIDRLIDQKLLTARPWSLAEADARSLALKLRDGTAWLLSPYL
jgi:cardiolipin synthase A/B